MLQSNVKKKYSVLIVDDDPRNIRILYEILGDDFNLSSAEDGEKALEKVRLSPPDIILLDIMMPGIDGYEVCKQLKNSDDYKTIKIILVSGKALTEERIKGYESGADDFVSKPFDMDEILAKVNVFAKLKSMEEVNKLKTDFICLINHEMGTPLNHIIGISDLLVRQGGLDDATVTSIEDISHAASKLGNKINNILFLARLKQQNIPELIDIDAKNLLDDVIQLLGEPPDQVDVKYQISDAVSFAGDIELIQTLFLHLFTVAISRSATPVICRITQPEENENKSGVLIEVSDSGEQLTDVQIKNYFDPFYTEDIMLHSEGLNIIMGICSQIVLMHNGEISINNNVTQGTSLNIYLPSNAQ